MVQIGWVTPRSGAWKEVSYPRQRQCFVKTLFFALFILSFSATVSAEREGYKLTPQQNNRMFFYSSSAPMTNAINEITPSVVKHIEVILGYVDFIEKQILTSLAKGRLLKPDLLSRLCTTSTPLFNNSIYRNFGLRGFPDPDRSCITDVNAEGDSLSENAPFSIDELYNAINERGVILNQNMKAIASRFIDVENNFTAAETPHSFVYNTHRAQCVLHAACGVRVGENWHVATPIHNRDKYENVRDFRRQVINEYARPVKGKLGDNLRLRLPVYRTDDLPREIREDATTYIVSWPKSAHPNCFRRTEIWENPAIVDTLDKVDHFLQQAEDALTPSSIAILVLPLALNLAPIALIADVSTITMLLYMLASDVLTCVPLLIKGIELIMIRYYPSRGLTVRITASSNGTKSESAGAEVWAAECRGPDHIGRAGIAFVVLSTVFVVAGVAAEVLARKYLREHRRKAQQAYSGKGTVLGVWTDQEAKEKPEDALLAAALSNDEERSASFGQNEVVLKGTNDAELQ